MKVLHVIPSISPLRGGPSKAVIEMVLALNDIGVTTEIATTNDNGRDELNVPLEQLSEFNGVPVRFFKRFSPAIHSIREFAYSGQYRNWINKNIHNYDIIHVHAIFSFVSSYTMYLARKRDVKYVVRPIGQLEEWSLKQSKLRKSVFLSLFEKENVENAAAIHFTADSELKQATKALPKLTSQAANGQHALVIPLGIKLPTPEANARSAIVKRYGLASDKRILLYLSRIHPKKGLELLFSALANLKQEKYQLLIAGDGEDSYLEKLQRLTMDLGIGQCCQFIGFKTNELKQELLQGADLYVLTSHSENFGIAVLESLAAGTPTLVSKGVALSALISEQDLGYVCDLTVEDVQHQLEYCLSEKNNAELIALGAKSRQYVEQHYRWGAIARELSITYQNIIRR